MNQLIKNKPTQARQQSSITCWFKVIKPMTSGGWQVLDDHLDYDQAETLAEENPGSFVRFSSYSVQKNCTKQPIEQTYYHPELTAENSRVVAVFDVREVTEYAIETIGSDLEYQDALQLQDSRKAALVEFSGYRRVPMPAMPEEPQEFRERRAQGYNQAQEITFRLWLLPLLTVVGLAALAILQKVGVL